MAESSNLNETATTITIATSNEVTIGVSGANDDFEEQKRKEEKKMLELYRDLSVVSVPDNESQQLEQYRYEKWMEQQDEKPQQNEQQLHNDDQREQPIYEQQIPEQEKKKMNKQHQGILNEGHQQAEKKQNEQQQWQKEQEQEFHHHYHQRQRLGAGITGSVLGFVLGGPIVGAISGIGTAYCCTREEDTPGTLVGDTARAMGDIALSAQEKLSLVNEKHQLTNTGKIILHNSWSKLVELDKEQNTHIIPSTTIATRTILNQGKQVAINTWDRACELDREQHIMETAKDFVQQSLDKLRTKI